MTASSKRAADKAPALAVKKRSRDHRAQVLIGQTANWLMDQTLYPDSKGDPDKDLASLFEGCCQRLNAAGVPIGRGHITFRVLHPLYASMGLTWRPDRGVEISKYAHGEGGIHAAPFSSSPFYHLITRKLPFLRRHLTGPEAVLDFPFLQELRDQGATDYFAFLLDFGTPQLEGLVGSWATDRPTGFSDQDIEDLQRVQKRLGVACKMLLVQQIAQNVVSTYLGESAGLKVLHGQIRRGDGERIAAVIWYADLRGSSALAQDLQPDDYIACLNAYFEAVGNPVIDEGGEILNFIGDAVLAIFPAEGGKKNARSACRRALRAGFAAEARIRDLNMRCRPVGAAPLSFGLALHFGDVVFGNVGLPQRLAFSVIGSTVNEVARLEALTKELGLSILASAAFAERTAAKWKPMGRHALRGIEEPIEVMAPIDA